MAAAIRRLPRESQSLSCIFDTPNITIFSGGTAFNSVANKLSGITEKVTMVLPTSDDGGSSAEIVRVLGGPAIGDIRSRCLRLSAQTTTEEKAVKTLLGRRLHKSNNILAKQEFLEIIEGEEAVWVGISDPYKDTIRSFLARFFCEILMSGINTNFNWCNGSVGNFFFTGARIFLNSIEAAVFLYARVSGIPNESSILPCIRTNQTQVISAVLENGEVIRGQSNISHPPGNNNAVDKNHDQPLPAKIQRLFYSSQDAIDQEIFPIVNPNVISKLRKADGVIFAMGSLYTSIIPSLILKGCGEAVSTIKGPKILLLNGILDRETFGLNAKDFVIAIWDALNRMDTPFSLSNPIESYVTHVLYIEGSSVPIDEEELKREFGIESIKIKKANRTDGKIFFHIETLLETLSRIFRQTQ